MFGSAKMASHTLFCHAGVFSACACLSCGCFRLLHMSGWCWYFFLRHYCFFASLRHKIMMLFTLCFAVVVFDLLFCRSCAWWDVFFVLCVFSDREDIDWVAFVRFVSFMLLLLSVCFANLIVWFLRVWRYGCGILPCLFCHFITFCRGFLCIRLISPLRPCLVSCVHPRVFRDFCIPFGPYFSFDIIFQQPLTFYGKLTFLDYRETKSISLE